jgi:UDP-N-acetyl-D-mannosaminuronate dehydrogenase
VNNDIIKTAKKINDYMPRYITKLIIKALKKTGKPLKTAK